MGESWYAGQRRRVEAAAAAAKVAKRQAECRNCRDGFPAYASFPDWHICPQCGKDCSPAEAPKASASGEGVAG